MLKLKFSLDPKDAKQMLALSRFAGTLADVAEIQAVKKSDSVEKFMTTLAEKPEAKEVALIQSASGLGVGPESPQKLNEENAPEPPKRKRRSKAEIEADEAAAKEEKPARETSGEEAESEAAEVEEEESDDAPAAKIEKPAKTAARGSITLDDVRRAVAEKKGTAENFQKMKDTLKEKYGVETTPKLDPKYYAEFYDFVNGLK